MKKALLIFILCLFSKQGFAHLLTINFDGTLDLYPDYIWVFEGCSQDNPYAYFGSIDTSMTDQVFANPSGNFLGAHNTDSPTCSDGSGIVSAKIGPMQTFGVIGMKLCIDIATGTSPYGNDGWDSDTKVIVASSIDGGTPQYIQFAGGPNDDMQPGLDTDCDGIADGYTNSGGGSPTYPITNSYSEFCFDLATDGAFFDLNITMAGFNEPGEDVAIDNIVFYYQFNANGLPDVDIPTSPSSPSCNLDCPLDVFVNAPECNSYTTGSDTYVVDVDYVCGGQGGGTYAISPSYSGNNPNIDTVGSLSFSGTEGSPLTFSIDDGNNCNFMETVSMPSCVVPCDVGSSDLVITEIMYDACSGMNGGNTCSPTGSQYWDNDSNGNWIEIYNNGSSTLDLSGYTIGSSISNNIYEFPEGININAGQYLVVAEPTIVNCMQASGINAIAACIPDNCPVPLGFTPFGGSNENIELKDCIGALVDAISYTGNECNSGSNKGYSLSLNPNTLSGNPQVGNDNANNWGPSLLGGENSSFGGGSPGSANTIGACISNFTVSNVSCNGLDGVIDLTFNYNQAFVTAYDVYVNGNFSTTLTGYSLGSGTANGSINIPNSSNPTSISIEIRPTGAPINLCYTETITAMTPQCPDACTPAISNSTAPPVVIASESICFPSGAGLYNGNLDPPLGNCPPNSDLEYSINNGTTWTNSLPLYDQNNSITVLTRCVCDYDSNDVSIISSVTTTPGSCSDSEIAIKVYLEGAYSGAGIISDLNNLNLLPVQHPYDGAPYNAPSASYSTLPIDAIDYVLIEARTTLSSSNVVQAIGVLLEDGNIVAPNGTPLRLALNQGSNYFIWVRHRNHLDIVSANAVMATANMNLDFTLSDTSVNGPFQVKQMFDGFYAMYAGDINQDGTINNTDYDNWVVEPAVLNTYYETDTNLDGSVQTTDYDVWFENRAKVGFAQLGL